MSSTMPARGAPIAAIRLEAWRTAERRLATMTPDDTAHHEAALDVVRAWLAYQHDLPGDPAEVIVVADNDRRFVAVSENVSQLLGYLPDELVGRRVDEFAAPIVAQETGQRWEQFRQQRRDARSFGLVAKDGRQVDVAYVANADVPLPGFHVSRLHRVG